MHTELYDENEAAQHGNSAWRIKNLILRLSQKLSKFLGLENASYLKSKGFEVEFLEEYIKIKVPRLNNWKRSANLFDQREALHRALVACMINQKIIDPSLSIIDAGSANGDCSIAWSRVIDGNVYAIDPSKGNLLYIQGIGHLNKIENLKTINNAIGETNGYLYPIFNLDSTPFSTVPLGTYGKKNRVRATTLDGLDRDGLLEKIGYIHLDVEGMELSAMRGARGLIEKNSPIITFEAHITIDEMPTIFQFLRDANYSTFIINESTIGGRPDCLNFLAMPVNSLLERRIITLNAVKPRQVYYKATIGENLIPIGPS